MPPQRNKIPTIICFGEALWDILPRGLFLGGAPLNVAYHLSRLGLRPLPVSAVGRDFLGDEALRRINDWGVSTDGIARLSDRPTGTVRATLNAAGVASYTITQRVAWDHIELPGDFDRIPPPVAIVYGSLALRGRQNRSALSNLLAQFPGTLRVADLNLRAPFDRGAGVTFALKHAQLLKLNDEELARVTGKPVGSQTALRDAARQLAQQHGGITRICVTAGARGAGLLWSGEWFWEPGRRVEVRDTIGAGDAFLAAFLAAHLGRAATPADALRSACRHGEFVAARDGATPPYRCDAHGRPTDAA